MTTVQTSKAIQNKVEKNILIDTSNLNPFNGLENKPAKKTVSQLTTLKTTINKNVDGEVKSVSKYFSEFRKNFDNINAWLKEAHTKGRTFNPELCHDILMNGKLSFIVDADKSIMRAKQAKANKEGKKFVAPTQWSANRMFVAFVHAVETTTK